MFNKTAFYNNYSYIGIITYYKLLLQNVDLLGRSVAIANQKQ